MDTDGEVLKSRSGPEIHRGGVIIKKNKGSKSKASATKKKVEKNRCVSKGVVGGPRSN